MTADAIPGPEPSWNGPAARLGYEDASRLIAAQYGAGVDLDTIAAHHHDIAASLASDAQTGPGRAYAAEYASTADSLIADLRADVAAGKREPEPAGTPHPDPRLAERGWQQCASGCGVWVRKSARAESPGKSAGTSPAQRKESTMTSHELQQPSEYDMAMGRNPAGEKAEDERYASGSHREELTGSLAKARDAHARREIDRAAAGYREHQADREAGA